MGFNLPAWVVSIGLDPDGDLALQAIQEQPDDLPGVDALEHRFLLGSVPDEGPSAVLFQTVLHRHGDDSGECEVFYAPDEETSLDDVDDDLTDSIAEVVGLNIIDPSTWDSSEEVEFDDSEGVEIEIDGPGGE